MALFSCPFLWQLSQRRQGRDPYVEVSVIIWAVFSTIDMGNFFCRRAIRENRKVSFLLEQRGKKGIRVRRDTLMFSQHLACSNLLFSYQFLCPHK
jgi:hypothetical protein